MNERRTLTLRTERLTDLTPHELRVVNGAAPDRETSYVSGRLCYLSDAVLSLCGCLSEYCSIEVC